VEDPELSGPSYAPLEIGKYIIYDVTNLAHDAFAERTDTTYFQIRETIESDFIDNSGNTVYKILVETSEEPGSNWIFVRYATLHRDNYSYHRVEDDIRKIKLSFPLKESKSWDANQMNTLASQKAKITNLDQSYSISKDLVFSNTLTIDLGNEIDPFFQNVESEVYAAGIGLIERKLIDVETQPGKYKDGNEYIQTYQQSNW
jgi:hypothetical protein